MTTIQLPNDTAKLTEIIRPIWWDKAEETARRLAGKSGSVTPIKGLPYHVSFDCGEVVVLPSSIVKYAKKLGQ